MKIVFDTFALMAYLRREPGHMNVRGLLEGILNREHQGHMSVINLGELYYMQCRKAGLVSAERALRFVRRARYHGRTSVKRQSDESSSSESRSFTVVRRRIRRDTRGRVAGFFGHW